MEHTNYRVAYCLGDNNECVSVALIKTVDQRTLNEMRNQVERHKQAQAHEKEQLLNAIKTLQDKCGELEHEIRVLKGEDE